MASASIQSSFLLFVSFSLFFLQGTLAKIVCEQLPSNVCVFSIASSGKRCLLEKSYVPKKEGEVEYGCRTSEVVAKRLADYIETDECVNACGVDRNTAGISSDAFFEPNFAPMLCSPACYQNCPNIVDLYYNLAAAEGVFLPILCETQNSNHYRTMVELLISSGGGSSGEEVASGPITSP